MIIGNSISSSNGFVGGGGGGSSVTPPLDLFFNSVGGWSVARKLRTLYLGSCIEVREDGGDTVADIGYDANGDLDEAALLLHCGVNSGYVRTIYDNSTVGNDGIQTTAANQPRIVNAGVVEKSNGKPAMFFDGVNDYLNCGTLNGGTKPSNWSFFSALSNNDKSVTSVAFASLLANSTTSMGKLACLATSIISTHGDSIVDFGTFTSNTNPMVDGDQTIMSLEFDSSISDSRVYHNDISLAGVDTGTAISGGTEYDFIIGANGQALNVPWNGYIAEIVSFNINNSTNRSDITINLNDYYLTY
jgi:hypothetical protein